MKIKLPRKRKKAYIQNSSRNDYHLAVIACEVMIEAGEKDGHKFPKKIHHKVSNVNLHRRLTTYW
jgi:hypothetical protein